jgi:HEPN domain-containing protein
LVAQWLGKANRDYDAAEHLLVEGDRFGEIIAFHCQQDAFSVARRARGL